MSGIEKDIEARFSRTSEEEETVSGDGVQELAFLLDEAAELIAMPHRIKDAARTAGKALMIQDKEIRRLRAENKELRASYERVEKYGQDLLQEREILAAMVPSK